MAYASIDDLNKRITRDLSADEEAACETLLADACEIIDAYAPKGNDAIKKIVACNMVIRSFGDGETSGVPIGASQGSMSALGYSRSWTFGNGAAGQLYLTKTEKRMLGIGNSIGSRSPLEDDDA